MPDSRLGDDGRGGSVEEILFGARDRAEVDAIVDRLCVTELGAGVSEVLFRASSVGAVIGVGLEDGRRVVVKAHQPREPRERLQAVHSLQAELHRSGFPCPEPLVGPIALPGTLLTAETLLDRGELRNTHEPGARRLIAHALAWHLSITAAGKPPAALAGAWSLFDGDRLWPVHAHAPMFDLAATGAGAEWIDRLAARAKAVITKGRPIAGHSDWSAKHFRFAGQAITAVYDWDSLTLGPEAAIVGVAAISFTTRFDLPGVSRVPTPEEMTAFVEDYSAARATPVRRAERRQIAAHALLLAAYTARCEHCGVHGYDADADPDSFTVALRAHGDAYLHI